MTGTTRGQFSTISVTARLLRPCAIQRCRRTGSEGSGRIDMAAKRLRAAPTRLARALFWLGRSPIALTLEKRILEAPATPGRPGMRKIAARFDFDRDCLLLRIMRSNRLAAAP